MLKTLIEDFGICFQNQRRTSQLHEGQGCVACTSIVARLKPSKRMAGNIASAGVSDLSDLCTTSTVSMSMKICLPTICTVRYMVTIGGALTSQWPPIRCALIDHLLVMSCMSNELGGATNFANAGYFNNTP